MAPVEPGWPLPSPGCAPMPFRSYIEVRPGHTRATPRPRLGYALGTPKSHPSHTRVTRGSNPSYSRTCPFYTRVGPKAHPSHSRVTLRLLPVTPTMHRGCAQSTPKSPRSNTRVTSGLHPDYASVLPWFRPACTPPGFYPGGRPVASRAWTYLGRDPGLDFVLSRGDLGMKTSGSLRLTSADTRV